MGSSRKFATIIVCGLIWGSAYALPHTIGPEKLASLADAAKEAFTSGAHMAELIDRLESRAAPEFFAPRPEALAAPSYERSTRSINHNPAPESHNENLLLAGLGMLGLIAWRRLKS